MTSLNQSWKPIFCSNICFILKINNVLFYKHGDFLTYPKSKAISWCCWVAILFFLNYKSAVDINQGSTVSVSGLWNSPLVSQVGIIISKYLQKSVPLCSHVLDTARLERKLTLWKCARNLGMAHKYYFLGSITADIILSPHRIYYLAYIACTACQGWCLLTENNAKNYKYIFVLLKFILKIALSKEHAFYDCSSLLPEFVSQIYISHIHMV